VQGLCAFVQRRMKQQGKQSQPGSVACYAMSQLWPSLCWMPIVPRKGEPLYFCV
jgi:hypothetical protein